MTLAANVALLCLTVVVNVFTLIYLVRSPWRSNHVGRIYAMKSAILSAVLIQITVAVWGSPDFIFRQQIRLAIYTLGALVYLPMICSLVREQQADRRRKSSPKVSVSESDSTKEV